MSRGGGFSQLRALDLYDTQVTDVGLVHLKELSRLQYLSLPHGSALTDAGVAKLKKALPNVEVHR